MGIGLDRAVTLLITVGDEPERLGTETSFAALWRSDCSASPHRRWAASGAGIVILRLPAFEDAE